MTTEPTKKTSKKDIEKDFRKSIYEKLSLSLDDYKTEMDENEFQDSLKKASKLLAKDISKGILAKNNQKKKNKIKTGKKNKDKSELLK
jgi:hypothetical protein